MAISARRVAFGGAGAAARGGLRRGLARRCSVATRCASAAGEGRPVGSGADGMVFHTDEEWRQLLTPGAFKVLRQAATEMPFSSPLYTEKRKGTFVCAGCGSPLFPSATKYESGTGWPSFWKPVDGSLEETLDFSIPFMPRTEYRCARCKGHVGHVFNDGPPPTGKRYCCNGLAMAFVPEEEA